KKRGRIRMRIGEAEVAAERAHAASPNARHAAFNLRERRDEPANERRGLQLAVCHGRTDAQLAVTLLEQVELWNSLQVDEIGIAGEAELHHQQQLGAATVESRVIAVSGQELLRLGHRTRSVHFKRSQCHATGAASRAITSSAASTPSPISARTPRSVS